MARKKRAKDASRLATEVEGSTAYAACERIGRNLGVIGDGLAKSKNVKGTVVHDVKAAMAAILDDVKALVASSVSEEVRKIHSENKLLRDENRELKEDMAAMREHFRARNLQGFIAPDPTPDTTKSHGLDELRLMVSEVVGTMKSMQQQYKALENKLLRPPLLHEKTSYAAKLAARKPRPKPTGFAEDGVTSDIEIAGMSSDPVPPKPVKGKGKGKKSRPATNTDETSEAPCPPPTSSQPADPNGGWTEVGRGGKPKRAPRNRTSKASREAKKSKPRRAKRQRVRQPRTAAVLIRLLPGAKERGVTYASVMEATRREVKCALGESGLKDVRLKGTLTDARMMHVAGPPEEAQRNADLLAEKLRGILPAADVRVTRPMKSVCLRLSGLDDSVTPSDVQCAVLCTGRVNEERPHLAEHIRVSEVRFGTFGLGVCWVTCPAEIAKIVVETGLRIGWTSPQIRVEGPRVLRCFRCMEPGHVGVKCKAKVDRSGLCFRCAQPGHKSQGCTAKVLCAVCADAGRPSGHRVGGPACAAAERPLMRRGKRGKPVLNAAPAGTENRQIISVVTRGENLATAPPSLLQGFSHGASDGTPEGATV